jgi:replicative DNA helicase
MTTQSHPIGHLILNPAQIPSARLPWTDLNDAERLTYGMLRSMHSDGKPINLMSLAVALQERGWLERVGGQQVLARWVDAAL